MLVVASALSASPLAAQTVTGADLGPTRPSRGLFGSGPTNPRQRQSLELLISAVGAQDEGQTLTSSVSGPVATTAHPEGFSTMRYRRGGAAPWLTVEASGIAEYRPQFGHTVATTGTLEAHVQRSVSRHGRLTVVGSGRNSPYYEFNPLPGGPDVTVDDPGALPALASNDYAVARQREYFASGAAQFEQTIGARTTISLGYQRGRVLRSDRRSDLQTEGSSFLARYRISRAFAIHAGGGIRLADARSTMTMVVAPPSTDTAPDPAIDLVSTDPQQIEVSQHDRSRVDDINIGLDFTRSLSSSRRTVFTFGSGSSIRHEGGFVRYYATGDVSMRRQIGRTWNVVSAFRRQLSYVGLFPRPFYADTISLNTIGQITRRVVFFAAGGYSSGVFDDLQGDDKVRTTSGTLELTASINRRWAAFSRYVYYRNVLARPLIDVPVPSRSQNQAVRFGVKLWLPVVR